MLRALIWIVLLSVTALFLAPIVVASLYVDQRGMELSGRVYSKDEYVRVRTGTWTRVSEVSFEYTLPETGGVSFFNVEMAPEKFDEYHKGQAVKLHYLRREDIPKLPGADAMWQMRILPHVRLEGAHAFDGLRAVITPQIRLGVGIVAAIGILLWVWRRTRLPGFAWAMGVFVVIGILALVFYDFPTPTPEPRSDVRAASGSVKSIRQIDWLLSTNKSRGSAGASAVGYRGGGIRAAGVPGSCARGRSGGSGGASGRGARGGGLRGGASSDGLAACGKARVPAAKFHRAG